MAAGGWSSIHRALDDGERGVYLNEPDLDPRDGLTLATGRGFCLAGGNHEEAARMAKRINHRKKTFKLTYSTMFDPPEELHARYERALAKLKGELGREHRMLIDGKEVRAQTSFEDTSPINHNYVLARFQRGGVEHAEQALAAARRSFPGWSGTPWRQRGRLLRTAARERDRG